MKTFIYTFIFTFIMIIGFNILVDRDYRYYQSPLSETRNLDQGECLNLGRTDSDRLLKMEIRKYIDQKEVAFLGSSRVSYVDESMIKKNISYYIHNFSVGILEDYIGVWQELKEQNKVPKKMIFFIDHWSFNKKNKFRAFEAIPYLKRFVLENNIKIEKFKKPWSRYTQFQYKKLVENLTDLVSFQSFIDSLKKLNRQGLNSEQFQKCSEIINDSKAFLVHDGHAIYPFLHPSEKEILELANDLNGALQFSDPWVLNLDIINYFKLMIKEAKSKGVEIVLVTPLWHPVSYQKLLETKHGKRVIGDYLNILKEISTELGVSSCLEVDANKVGCFANEFADSIHMESACTQKFLRYCSKFSKTLTEIIN